MKRHGELVLSNITLSETVTLNALLETGCASSDKGATLDFYSVVLDLNA